MTVWCALARRNLNAVVRMATMMKTSSRLPRTALITLATVTIAPSWPQIPSRGVPRRQECIWIEAGELRTVCVDIICIEQIDHRHVGGDDSLDTAIQCLSLRSRR